MGARPRLRDQHSFSTASSSAHPCSHRSRQDRLAWSSHFQATPDRSKRQNVHDLQAPHHASECNHPGARTPLSRSHSLQSPDDENGRGGGCTPNSIRPFPQNYRDRRTPPANQCSKARNEHCWTKTLRPFRMRCLHSRRQTTL